MDNMNVVYTFDDGYTDITMVSILSFLETNKDVKDINLFIVDCGISEANMSRIKNLVCSYDRRINVVKAIDVEEKIPINLEKGYWSLVCYVRLFFAEMFPDIDRIMHIDCDTIVRGNLEHIYNVDIEYNSCAMCYDCLPSPKYAAGFEKNEEYFSNGFIIFNLKYFRDNNIEEKFIDYIVEKNGILPHLDQDAVSAVLKGNIYLLPPQYNVMSVSFALGSSCTKVFEDEEPYYNNKEMESALKDPVIVHYVGYRFFNRPWKQPCYHPYNQEWIDYYKKIDGYKEKLITINCSISKRIILYFWNIAAKVNCLSLLEQRIELIRFRKKAIKSKKME